jgi:hypothetical protein
MMGRNGEVRFSKQGTDHGFISPPLPENRPRLIVVCPCYFGLPAITQLAQFDKNRSGIRVLGQVRK